MSDRRGTSVPPDVGFALRDLNNALGKATMYPAGHRMVLTAAAQLTDRLATVLETRGDLLIGITPRGILLDGTPAEPLPTALRDLAARLHRKNVGTMHLHDGLTADEVAELLGALAAGDADEAIGREGLRLTHVRVEPLVYDVVGFAEQETAGGEVDDAFWVRLIEAVFGRQFLEGETLPTPAEVAAAIEEGSGKSGEQARRLYQALASFSTALAGRPERTAGNARRRFGEVLGALSRSASSHVLTAAPTTTSRRRFLRETLEQVPPALLLQLLESVAEADGAPLSPHLRWMLGKLAGNETGARGEATSAAQGGGAFSSQVLGLIEHWDGVRSDAAMALDPRMAVDGLRTVALGLAVASAGPAVLDAAQQEVADGRLSELLALIDRHEDVPETAKAIAQSVLDPTLLPGLLAAAEPDWTMIERIAHHATEEALPVLVDALEAAESRNLRRRVLDLIGSLGSGIEPALLARLPESPWYLARNLLLVLGQLPPLSDPAPVEAMLSHEEPRVQQEALKLLVRHPLVQQRAISIALESNEPALIRIALAALDKTCPPEVVGSLLSLLVDADDEMQLQVIRLVADSPSPLVVGPLLSLVRFRGGIFRRWRLRPTTPVMLAALVVLGSRWGRHRQVMLAMQQAARSDDPTVQEALRLMRGATP